MSLFLGRSGSLRCGWRALAFYLAVSAGYGFLLWALHGVPGVPRAAYPAGLCAVLLLASWLFLTLEARPLRSLGLRLGAAWARDYGKGLLAGMAVILLTAALLFLLGGFHLARNPASGAGTLASGAVLYLVPAVNEELGFRGYLFQRLEWGLGTWGGLALLSLLFATAHLGNPGQAGALRLLAFVNIFLAGVLLGLAYLGTRSLALPMGLHLGWNWTQGTLLGFGVSGTSATGLFSPTLWNLPPWLTGGAFGLEGSLACTLVCGLACLLMARIFPVTHSFSIEEK